MLRQIAHTYITGLLLTLMAALVSCNSTKHVPEGRYLLDDVSLKINDSTHRVSKQQLITYIRQQPNTKMLWSAKFRLGLYNLSGKDSTKRWNKWMRKLGEPPAIYDSMATVNDISQLKRALVNAGYMEGDVSVKKKINDKKRKIKLEFDVTPGTPHIIRSLEYDFPNDTIRNLFANDSSLFLIAPGDILDLSRLETQRDVFVNYLRDNGYFAFGKESISFTADTAAGSKDVDLHLSIHPPKATGIQDRIHLDTHKQYLVRNIYVIPDYSPGTSTNIEDYQATDTLHYKGLTILESKKRYLNPQTIFDNCFIRKGELYSAAEVNATYAALSRLSILKFINIRFIPSGKLGDFGLIDAYILLTPGKSQSFSAELEGTNSEGNFGVAAALHYTHRNLSKGSETFSAKLRGAYEALNGSFQDIIHNRYLEFGGEVGINFPKFKAPFLKESFKRKIKASTEFNISMNYQERPEYTRLISTAGWNYKWTEHKYHRRHTYTPIDVNYVYLPESTNDFLNQIAPDNPLLRYSYEDHFIMRMGYSLYQTNKQPESPFSHKQLRDIYTLRVNAEIAGNLLFAISSLARHRSNFHDDPYKVFGIRYSQYVKVDADFSYLHVFDERNSIAYHAGGGIGVPYGNSSILPFEKRFYGGGANGVRGWDVRTLGPGRFPGSNSVSDFINQCGDIRLDFNVEYRPKLFWILEGALFIDIGNIWTIHNYPNQPHGFFKFKSFYKELAAAYGVGLRLDFKYFLLRFDMGMKAHNPAINQEPWPIIHPVWKRDRSFHFSIGYPF